MLHTFHSAVARFIAFIQRLIADFPTRFAGFPSCLGSSPRRLANFPRHLAGLPRRVAELPRRLAKLPRHLPEFPRRLAKLPSRLADFPRHLAELPRRLGNPERCVFSLTIQAWKNPKSMSNVKRVPSIAPRTHSVRQSVAFDLKRFVVYMERVCFNVSKIPPVQTTVRNKTAAKVRIVYETTK
jgi:hypothetical protein